LFPSLNRCSLCLSIKKSPCCFQPTSLTGKIVSRKVERIILPLSPFILQPLCRDLQYKSQIIVVFSVKWKLVLCLPTRRRSNQFSSLKEAGSTSICPTAINQLKQEGRFPTAQYYFPSVLSPSKCTVRDV